MFFIRFSHYTILIITDWNWSEPNFVQNILISKTLTCSLLLLSPHALISLTNNAHSVLFISFCLHLFTLNVVKSSSTSSSHLVLHLPIFLLAFVLLSSIFLTTLFSIRSHQISQPLLPSVILLASF